MRMIKETDVYYAHAFFGYLIGSERYTFELDRIALMGRDARSE
jgi:hypothetical protein